MLRRYTLISLIAREKSQQGKMMDDIFHSAKSVQIWLRDVADDSDERMDFAD